MEDRMKFRRTIGTILAAPCVASGQLDPTDFIFA
jgi:hypothetical protein